MINQVGNRYQPKLSYLGKHGAWKESKKQKKTWLDFRVYSGRRSSADQKPSLSRKRETGGMDMSS